MAKNRNKQGRENKQPRHVRIVEHVNKVMEQGAKKVQQYTGGYSGYGGADNHDHFRFKLPIGKRNGVKYYVYLTSSRGFDVNVAKEGAREIDFGVYLDFGWKSRLTGSTSDVVVALPEDIATPELAAKWEYSKPAKTKGIYLPWPDRGIVSWEKADMLLQWLDEQIDAGKRIEIACFGGHGRTGTLAAALVIYRNKADGRALKAKDVIDYIRGFYCDHAIESDVQEDFLYALNDEEPPERKKKAPPASTYKPPVGSGSKYPVNAGASVNEIKAWNYRDAARRLPLDFLSTPRKEVVEEEPPKSVEARMMDGEIAPQQNTLLPVAVANDDSTYDEMGMFS